jgi:acyl-CoA synthetase (AMP-forming)/AMP-acid ligase II
MRGSHGPTLLDQVRERADQSAHRNAVVGPMQTWTYRELVDRSNALAHAVPKSEGPVAIVIGNEPSFLAAILGSWAAGRAALLIDPRLALPEIRELVDTHAPGCVMVDMTTPPEVSVAAKRWAPVIVASEHCQSRIPPDVGIDPGSPAIVLFTAGSTGPAKAVVHSHMRLSLAAETLVRHRKHLVRRLTPLRAANILRRFPSLPWRLWKARAQPVWTTPMTLTSISGLTIASQSLSSGGTLVTTWPFSPSSVWVAIRSYGVNVLAVAPPMLSGLLESRRPGDEASLVVVGVGGGPVPPGLCVRAEAELGCPVIVGYGSTELGGGVLATAPWDRHDAAGDVGQALAGTEWRIVDEWDRPVPPGVVGELAHRSPGIMLGYANAEAREIIDSDGWYRTGDLAVATADARVRLIGRRDGLIQRKGHNISPAQIEEVLQQHPDVAECAVVGLRSTVGDATIEAQVVPIPGSSLVASSLEGWCARRLSRQKLPDRYVIVSSMRHTDAAEPRRADLLRGAAPIADPDLH